LKTYVNFDGTCWPNPLDPNEIEWKLRYGEPTKAELLQAASFVSAYKQLMHLTQKDVLYSIKKIKEKQCD
jgi:arylsulfatase A-like enzyme